MSDGREFHDGEMVPGTRYQVLAQIGSGGMGSVYVVEHTELGKRFVLKALLRELARRSDLVARLRQEWRALARLNHPNIINVTDAGTSANGVPFYVMELVEGQTLAARLAARRRLPLADALAIGVGVLDGLAAAHAIGIVHRDIKPPNIFLVGQTGVKLLDFGIAKIAHSNAEVITARGVAVGTPRYMSPEQARGEAVDGRADLYATGLLLFEMVSGVGPFDDAKDANELLLAHLGKQAARLSWAATGVPPELDRIVAWLLAKDPARRPMSAEQVASSLREIAARAASTSSTAPAPSLRQDSATEASISAVPTNPLPIAGQEPTVVPPGGFTQIAPTDPVPSLAHSQNTVAGPIGSSTTQFETPRAGTPERALAAAPESAPKRISVGPAPKSAELDPTVAVAPPGSGDTLHSPAAFSSEPSSSASSGRDRTLRLDEPVPMPVDAGPETHTSVPLGVPGGETPPPVESGAPMSEARSRGMPGWIPLALSGLVIAALVAVATWVFISSSSSASHGVASPPPVPEPTPAATPAAPPATTEPTPEPVVAPTPSETAAPVATSQSTRSRTDSSSAKPTTATTTRAAEAPKPGPVETSTARPAKPAEPKKPAETPSKKPGLVLPGSGL